MCIFFSLNKAPFYVAPSSASTLTPSFTRQIALPSLHIFRGNISHWTWTHSHITEAVDFHCQTHYKREKKRWLTPPPVVIRINLESPRLMKCDDLSLEWLINVSADTHQIFRSFERGTEEDFPCTACRLRCIFRWWRMSGLDQSDSQRRVQLKWQWTLNHSSPSEWSTGVNGEQWIRHTRPANCGKIKTNHDQVPAMKVCELSSSDMWIITILPETHLTA